MNVCQAQISQAEYERMRALIPELPGTFEKFCSECERRLSKAAETSRPS